MIKNKEIFILLTIVILDLITKLLANYYLPFEQDVSIIGNTLNFHLTYNQEATGAQADFFLELEKEQNKNLTIVLNCINKLILLTYILLVRTQPLKTIYKTLVGIALFVILSVLFEIAKPLLADLNISSWVTSIIGKVTGLTLFGTLFYYSKNKLARLSILFILACGVGNLVSHFYSPFLAIDFIYVEGLYEIVRIGIFNLADLSNNIGQIGLIIFFLVWTYKKLTRRQSDKIYQSN